MTSITCSVEDCSTKPYSRGWCSKHYQRWSRWGDPNKTKLPRHGGGGMSEYWIWVDIRRRCLNPDRKGYKDYGGRGITVCDRWNISFQNFIDDMGERPSKDHSIERVDNNGNYEPSNCRWATRVEQANNRRSNHTIIIGGKSKTIAQWCREYGIPDTTFHNRLNRGWTGRMLLDKRDNRKSIYPD